MAIQGINNNIYAAKYTTIMPDIDVLQSEVIKVVESYELKKLKNER